MDEKTRIAWFIAYNEAHGRRLKWDVYNVDGTVDFDEPEVPDA